MKLNIKSRKGFTLIELLVVIGILAVLAAIAIPSVAGLIDRANVSADKTNSNEMTNAVERFASEYELYCQDIASGVIKESTTDFDSAQGRVYNVTGVKTRAGIETLEVAQDAVVTDDQIAIYRDTKYPVNAETMKKVVENYTKTSSSTFEPKQSDMHYWYSPDCGVVVFAEPDADQDKENKLNSQIQSGMDAKGNKLSASTQWIDLTLGAALSGGSASLPEVGKTLEQYTWEEARNIIAAGKATEYGFAVGSTKTLQINGTTNVATIIGLNHDGSNTATFMILNSNNISKHQMNPLPATNEGGWEASEMRAWLNGDFYNSMSNQDYIKTVTKMTNNIGENGRTATAITNTQDKVFLLSIQEVGLQENAKDKRNYKYMSQINAEGTTYEWFETNSINSLSWFRSTYIGYGGAFFCYDYSGITYYMSHANFNVCPAFVIG